MIQQLAPVMLCLALSTVAHAGTIVDLTLDGDFAPPDYVFYSYTDMSGQQQNNIPVDPYITYLNGPGYDNTLVYTFGASGYLVAAGARSSPPQWK